MGIGSGRVAFLLQCVVSTVLLTLVQKSADGQQPPDMVSVDTTRALRVFLDCDAKNTPGCDDDFLRTELPWIQYTRDRTDAHVHVLATALTTGSGGTEVLLRYIGLQAFTGLDDEIRFQNPQGATDDDTRRRLARVMALGLARYAMRTQDGVNLELQHRKPDSGAAASLVRDRWNSWLFGIGASGSGNGESRSSSSTLSANFTAQRTTARWKFESLVRADLSKSSYKLSDSTRYVAEVRSQEGSGLIVRAMGQHLSLGTSVSAYSYTVDNYDLAATIAPTVEVDIFPFREFTRRRLVVAYSLGLNYFDYTDTTLFGKVQESRIDQVLWIGLASKQAWGNADLGVTLSNYPTDFAQNKIKVTSELTFRVTRGLQLRGGASFSRVRDQINLPKEDATDEEVLLKLRSLRTNYRYSAQFGLQYTFGSVLNNVVNPRMSSNGR